MTGQPWLDAQPLLGLVGTQFLKLMPPCIFNPEQLWSVRHQYLRSGDRLQVLERQEALWSDDELRFHLHSLCTEAREAATSKVGPIPEICVLDPLISTAWIHDKGFPCDQWAHDHADVRTK